MAPDAPDPYDMAPMGRQWFNLRDRDPQAMAPLADVAAPLLDRFIDAELDRLGLARDAVALMGFSQGAMMALHVGLHRTPPPVAILAYSGALLAPERLRAGAAPVLLVHGEADDVVPAERSRSAEAALQAAGIAVESQFSGQLGHGIDEAGLSIGALFLQRGFALAGGRQAEGL